MLIKERHQPNQSLEVVIARSISDYFGLKETIEYFEKDRVGSFEVTRRAGNN